MTKVKFNKNTLPLLAITALFLSVALVNYDQSLVSNSQSKQSVLSESNENSETRIETRNLDRKDARKVEVRGEVKREIRKETERPKFRPSPIEIEEDDNDRPEIDDEQNESTPDTRLNRFRLKANTVTRSGKTTVETESGDIEVKTNPEDIINDLVDSGELDKPMTLEPKENQREKVEFEIQGTDSKKFLGIFKVVIPKTLTVSSETGEVISTSQNIWSRILSLLSN